MATILAIFKNIKNIVILIWILLFLAASGTATFYKINYDKLKLKNQADQIAFYEQSQKEIKKHLDRVNVLNTEKEALKTQINALKMQGNCQNEDYYMVFDNITNRFNGGL